MKVKSGWVKPPQQITGLDHLAVQAPCTELYGRLLPGITNVTDRARYYTFYPWVIWSFDKRGWRRFDEEFVARFRRADCLFTLVAIRHARVSGGAYEDHAGAAVGSGKLAEAEKRLDESTEIRLDEFATREGGASRYFKNKMGGLGQYYIGVLRELRILSGDSSGGPKYTRLLICT